jgi:hypothetical protein
MVLGPSEILKAKDVNAKNIVEKLVPLIDQQLMAKYNGQKIVRVSIDAVKGSSLPEVRDRIREMYGEKGWNLKWDSHQLQGSWIDFTTKREPILEGDDEK